MKNELVYRKMPRVWPTCFKIIFLKRKGVNDDSAHIPVRAVIKNYRIDSEHLKRYIEVCGLTDDGALPILYPHVFTAPLQMAVVSHRDFPVSCLGILHYRNHIIQYRRIMADEELSVSVELVESRIIKQGAEFDYTIKITSGSELVWESITTYLKKGKFGKKYSASPLSDIIHPVEKAEQRIEHYIPDGIGKRYAKICGDFNPIHMSKMLARLFGYRATVAHAFWAAGSGAGLLSGINYDKPVRVDMTFKGPLFTGSRSHIETCRHRGDIRFDYYCGDNPRPSVNVKISRVKENGFIR